MFSQATMKLYEDALARGLLSQFWAGLIGRTRGLLSLKDIFQPCTVQSVSSGGTRLVAITQIDGSENRAADFDRDFNPLQDHTRDRWLSVAAARQRGRRLPPVALIQVGDHYFVQDGHHRISVARALGQDAIEATIEVWILDETLAWEQPSQDLHRTCANNCGPFRRLAGAPLASFVRWLATFLRAPDRAAVSQGAG